MKHMTLSEITDACCGIYCGDPAFLDCEVSSVAIDSRKVIKDTLFVAIKGARVDGHSFIPQVMEAGALCSLSEQDLGDVDYPYIRVSSCTEALKDLAEHYRRSLDIKVVGITGSVGKTSTKEMIASVLSEKYNVLKTEGNFNNEIGLPLTVFNIREEHEVAVLEMGISHFGDMKPLAKIARPDVCVITNIGYAHLENLGTRDGILKEKSSMTDYMNPKGSVIFNGDDDKLKSYTSRDGRTPVYFGLTSSCPFHVENIERKGLKGTYAEFVTPTSRFHAHISIPGDHMIYNALAGVAVGYALGMNNDEIARGIEKLVPIAERNNLIEAKHYTIIDDCYNANPASMKSSLDVLAYADTRKVAILGDMGELGADELAMHREVGAYAAFKNTDVLVCIGALSKDMAEAAKETVLATEKNMKVFHFDTKEDFYQNMGQILKENDTILVKASHFMEFPEIVKILSEEA